MPYTPFLCNITAITQDNPVVATTEEDHLFLFGDLVTFHNGLKGYVSAITANTITFDIDPSTFLPFIEYGLEPSVVIDPAEIIPIGSAMNSLSLEK